MWLEGQSRVINKKCAKKCAQNESFPENTQNDPQTHYIGGRTSYTIMNILVSIPELWVNYRAGCF